MAKPVRKVASPPAELDAVDPSGTRIFAQKLARAYDGYVRFLAESYKLTREEAEAKVHETVDRDRKMALKGPPEQVSWTDLSTLAKSDPDAAIRAWRRLHDLADEELESGNRAASVVSYGFDFGPYDRARFLAVRAGLVAEWQPLPGSETMLVDQLAQLQVLWEEWMGQHVQQLRIGCAKARSVAKMDGIDIHGSVPPRLSEAEAFDHSMAMLERINRMSIRTIRALRDLKRFVPSVVVQNAGQVNVGEKQVNVVAEQA